MKTDERPIINRGLKLPAVLKRGAPQSPLNASHDSSWVGVVINDDQQRQAVHDPLPSFVGVCFLA
jgi:hypothetical protein